MQLPIIRLEVEGMKRTICALLHSILPKWMLTSKRRSKHIAQRTI
jgi:hypothetical protein